MNSIKVGIIGIGNIGSAHLNSILSNQIQGLEVIAICDNNAEKIKILKKKYSDLLIYDKYTNLLENEDIQAVIICVPHKLHVEIAIEALKFNKHILVEKPIDISVSKAILLNNIAKKSDRIFAVMFNQRTNKLFQKAKQLIDSGDLGKIRRSVWIITNWFRTQNYYNSGDWRATWFGEGGGVLLNQAPHNLDLWQWICGMPKKITAFCNSGKFHNIEVEDEATIIAEFENGAFGTFITSTGEFPGTNRLEISCTKGKLVIESNTLKCFICEQDCQEISENSDESFAKINTEYKEFAFDEVEGHKAILQNFANAILYGEELISPGFEAINQLMITNASYLSEWYGNKPISIPFDFKEYDKLLSKKQQNSSVKAKANNLSLKDDYIQRWNTNW